MIDMTSYMTNINLHMMNMNMDVNTKTNVNVNIMSMSMSILWFWSIDIHIADEGTLSIDFEIFKSMKQLFTFKIEYLGNAATLLL